MGIIFRGKKSGDGFTLVELVCVLAVLAVLAMTVVPGTLRWVEKAKISRYVTEAHGVLESIRIYSIETYVSGELDTMEMMEDLTCADLNSKQNPLAPYLLVSCSGDAVIEDLTLDAGCTEVVGIVYLVGKYRIEMERENVKVMPREGGKQAV